MKKKKEKKVKMVKNPLRSFFRVADDLVLVGRTVLQQVVHLQRNCSIRRLVRMSIAEVDEPTESVVVESVSSQQSHHCHLLGLLGRL